MRRVQKALSVVFVISLIFISNGFAGDNDSLVVTESGNVGIGTTNPPSTLSVSSSKKEFARFLTTQGYHNNYMTLRSDGEASSIGLQIGLNLAGHMSGIRGGNGLRFMTGGNEGTILDQAPKMTIDPSGNVGIGTTNPAFKFEVNGGWMRLVGTGGTSGDPATRIGVYDTDNTGGVNGWWMSQNNNGSFGIDQHGVGDRFVIDGSGDVGIGTTSPISKLNVNIPNTANNTNGLYVNQNDPDAEYVVKFASQSGNFYFENSTGRVGIGTDSPSQKLDVNGNVAVSGSGTFSGNVTAGNVYAGSGDFSGTVSAASGDFSGTVSAYQFYSSSGGGADYVFEPDYPLPSLDSVKTYVQENRHLPEVPSAAEMQQNGLNLSDQMILHLKKIEELTLYMIDLKEENETLKRENHKLKNYYQSFEKRLAKIEAQRNEN